jgi:hypothetical protein
MKHYGDIVKEKTWKHTHLFQVQAQNEPGASREVLRRARQELEGLRQTWDIDFQSRKRQHEQTENELMGFVAGDHEHLRSAQKRLQSLGWEHDPKL